MSFPVVCVGDANAAGGLAMAPRPTVIAAGRPLAAFSSPVSPHPCCGAPGCDIHCVAVITGGSATVLAEGLPVHRVMDIDTCAHPRTTGVPNVLVGGPGLGGGPSVIGSTANPGLTNPGLNVTGGIT